MKRLFVLLIFLFCSCSPSVMNKCPCPSQDVIFGAPSTGDNMFMPKGYLDEDGNGTFWVPYDDYDAWFKRKLDEFMKGDDKS